MQGNFSYYNPTKLYFGDDALKFLSEELTKYGPTVMLCYGGGRIKRNGIYEILRWRNYTRVLEWQRKTTWI